MAVRRFGAVYLVLASVAAACSSFSSSEDTPTTPATPDASVADAAAAPTRDDSGPVPPTADSGVIVLESTTFAGSCGPLAPKHGIQVTPDAQGCRVCFVDGGDGAEFASARYKRAGDGGTYAAKLGLARAGTSGTVRGAIQLRAEENGVTLAVDSAPQPIVVSDIRLDPALTLTNPPAAGDIELTIEVWPESGSTCLLVDRFDLAHTP